jgi:hypothetical protein
MSYVTENILQLLYKDQPVNAARGEMITYC